MLSVNHSVEDITRYERPQRTSQVNPNLSSTNIFQLNQPRPHRGLPKPAPHYYPLTPPSSNSPTPVLDRKDVFQLSSHASSTTSLDTYAAFVDATPAAPEPWYRKWAPEISWDVVLLCGFWYAFLVVSANSTKAILSQFPHPVTLTQFQFSLNALLCCVLYAMLLALPGLAALFPAGAVPSTLAVPSLARFVTPSAFVISTTLPMGLFQFVGHITSHKATSVIPVSLVHSIKALSPLVTVAIYRVFYRVHFDKITYVTLVPLILGIMLTCYKPKKVLASEEGYLGGLLYAVISMLIFVSQNIFAKKRLTYDDSKTEKTSLPSYKNGEQKKLDKLTILLFCSIIGFVFTMPFYMISEYRNEQISLMQLTPSLATLVVLNGLSHFMQSLLAFLLLGTVSTINYSIANIMKRIFVILFAFFWEASFAFTGVQTYGIVLTVFGLYAYDKWGLQRKK